MIYMNGLGIFGMGNGIPGVANKIMLTVAQSEQSAWLLSRKPQVQVLPGVPV